MTEEERRGIINQQQRSRKRKRGKRHRRKQQVAGDSPPPSLEQTLNANTKNRSSPAAAVVKCNFKARIASSSFLDKVSPWISLSESFGGWGGRGKYNMSGKKNRCMDIMGVMVVAADESEVIRRTLSHD